MPPQDTLQARAKALQLNGLLAHWTQVTTEGWVNSLIDWEEQERARRSLERRLREAERNAAHLTDFFNLPGDQVVEIGRQISI